VDTESKSTIDPLGNARATGEHRGPGLRPTLGTGAIVFLVLAAAAPLISSVAIVPMSIVFSENSAAPFLFLVVIAILCLFSVGYTAMSKNVTDAGAFYSYIEAGLGRVAGTGSAMLALGAYAITLLALTVFGGPMVSDLVAKYTSWNDSPWWLWALVFWLVLAVIGYRNVELSSKVVTVLLALEVVVILALDVSILFHGGADGVSLDPLSPVSAFDHGKPSLGIMWAALCFVGFEATAVFRQEAKDPERTIPRATYVAIIVIGAFYTFTAWCMVLGGGADAVAKFGGDPTGTLFVLSGENMPSWYADVLSVLILGSIFASALAFHNVVNRYQVAMSRGGVLPKYVGRIHEKHGSPSAASGVLSTVVLVAIFIVMVSSLDPLTQVLPPLLGILAYAVLILMTLVSLASPFYFRRVRHGESTFRTTIAPAGSVIALTAVLWLAFSNIDTITGSRHASVIVLALLVSLPIVGVITSILTRFVKEELETES
jgi:amino acid transporter